VAGALGLEERRVPAARAAGTLPSSDLGVLVVGGRRGRRERWGASPPERWEDAPPSPRATVAAEEQAPGAGAEAPAAGRYTEEAARATEVPARATEVSGSATVATSAAATVPIEPSTKRNQGFSTLRWAIAPPDAPFERQEFNLSVFAFAGWRRPSPPRACQGA
jgi:hypothetical protein